MPSRHEEALRHIRDNIERAQDLASRHSRESFAADWQAFYAAVRCLEIISEATRRLPSDLLERHPQIPWRRVQDAGNVYRHGYEVVEPDVIWVTITLSLPPMAEAVGAELTMSP